MGKKTTNARVQLDTSPGHAKLLIKTLRDQGLTTEQIAIRAGVTTRTIYQCVSRGFRAFPLQVTLEHMAGLR